MAFRMIIDVYGVKDAENEEIIKKFIERAANDIISGPDGATHEITYTDQEKP